MKLIKNVTAGDLTISDLIFGQLQLSPNEEFDVDGRENEFIASSSCISYIRDGSLQVGDGGKYYTDPIEGEVYFSTRFGNDCYMSSGATIQQFSPIIVQDSSTGKKSTSLFMNILTIMKEFYNSPSDPLYDSSFQKFIGTGGRELEHLGRTDNLENIHSRIGWHQRDIWTHGVKRPFDLLIYYGYPNSFNSATNAWTNELVAQDMAKYELVVLGNGVAVPSHPDYANTQIIIPRVKALNANCKVFGYVSLNQTLVNFQTAVDQWNTLQVDGIFIDESGYDYGTVATNGREAFNTKVTYIHGKTYSNLCFVNSWNMNHIIGTTNDVSFPNTTWNPSLTASSLTAYDWYLLESFPVNTTAYSGNAGYESKSDWATRGSLAIVHKNTYGINLASVSVISNTDINAQKLFDFSYLSALQWSLDAVGSSDDSYGSGSATVNYWNRQSVINLGRIWSASPSVVVDVADSDVYYRYFDYGKVKLDHSTGAQLCSIIYDDLDRTMSAYVKKINGNWSCIGNATTLPLADGIAAPSTTGTATARNIATTNLFTSIRRLGYVSAATAGSSAGPRLAALQFWRGNAIGLGGFNLVVRFGVSDAAAVADARMFVGMIGVSTVIGNVNPTTLTNLVGVGCNNSQTNLYIIYNDASGTASTVNLGSNFPSAGLSLYPYELTLFCLPNGSYIKYRLVRLDTGYVAEGILTTDIPANTQLLAPQLWRNNGATALAVGIDLMSLSIETDN